MPCLAKNVVTIDIETPPKADVNKAINANANKTKLGFSALTEDVVTNRCTTIGDTNERHNGTADTTVNIKHGDTFHAALKKAGAKYLEYIRIEGDGHGVFHKSSNKTYPAMEKFFETHLR